MQGTQYATKRSILCRGAFCGPTVLILNAFITTKFGYCPSVWYLSRTTITNTSETGTRGCIKTHQCLMLS